MPSFSRFALLCGLCSIGLELVRPAHAQPAPEPPPPAEAAAPAPAAPGEVDAGAAPAPEAPEPEVTAAAPGSGAVAPEKVESADSGGSGLFEESLSGPAAATDSAAPAAAQLPFDLNGYVRGDMFVGKAVDRPEGEMKAAYGELALLLKTKKEGYGDAMAEFRLRYGQQGRDRDLFVDLREAYVNAYLGPLDLRLGHQIIVWGRADAFNPTNVLTPADLRVRSPIEDDRRLGNAGARGFLKLEPLRIEGVWMPIYTPVELPLTVLPDFVTIERASFPDPHLDRGLLAGRVHLELADFEMSASYVHGFAPLPGLTFSGYTAGIGAEIRIDRTPYTHHVVGFDFSTALGELLAIRGEAAYRRPVLEDRYYVPRPDLQYVLGLDRAFGSVSVIVQYMGRYVFDWRRATGVENPIDPAALAGFTPPLGPMLEQRIIDSVSGELSVRNQILFSQNAELQHLGSVRLEWVTLHDALSLSALGMLNVTTEEWLVYPKLGYKISDAMSTYVGGEIYMGPDETLFGLIDQELSAAYAELRYSF